MESNKIGKIIFLKLPQKKLYLTQNWDIWKCSLLRDAQLDIYWTLSNNWAILRKHEHIVIRFFLSKYMDCRQAIPEISHEIPFLVRRQFIPIPTPTISRDELLTCTTSNSTSMKGKPIFILTESACLWTYMN